MAVPLLAVVASQMLGSSMNNENQKQLLEQQNSFTHEMWKETNQYNSPSNQYALYKQAGLNPMYFMAGNGAAQAQTVQSSTAPSPAGDYSKLADILMSGRGYDLQEKALDLQDKELNQKIQESNSRIRKLAAETTQIEIDNETRAKLNEKTISSLEETIKQTAANTANLWEDKRLKIAQRKYQEAAANEAEQRAITEDVTRKLKVDNLVQDIFLKKSQIHVNDQDAKLIGEQIVGFILSNGEKAINYDKDGLGISILKNQDNSLKLDLKIKDNDEYIKNARRFGFTQDQETQGYINGIASSLIQGFGLMLLSRGLSSRGRSGEVISPGDPNYPKNTNTGYQGTYGPRP